MDGKRHEVWGLLALAAAVLLVLALGSFNTLDPSPLKTSTVAGAPRNLAGAFGASVSAVLLHVMGLAAWVLAAAGLAASWSLFRGRARGRAWAAYGAGLLLLIASASGLFALFTPQMRFLGQTVVPGGLLGAGVSRLAVSQLGRPGAWVILLALFLLSFLLATPFTFAGTARAAGRALSGAFGALSRRREADADPVVPLDDVVQEAKPPRRREAPKPDPEPPSEAAPKEPPRREPRREAPPPAPFLPPPPPGVYLLPPLDLLDRHVEKGNGPDEKMLKENAKILEEKLADFGVQGRTVGIRPGPVITMYEYAPAPGIKISRIVSLSDDLSMALRAESIRVVAPIPGKAAVGIEIPNDRRELVAIRPVVESEAFRASTSALTMAFGKDITGQPAVANLARMPHLLIAGATGTGKSVCINTVLASLLYRNTPEDLQLLLIDPKRIELSSYEGIPHLLHPVVTDAKMATRALRWAVQEMELRYKMLADMNVRNIESYNRAVEKPRKPKPEDSVAEELQHHHLPYIVIIIDELADLMMVSTREVEESITRLAQMARAAGIHLILATQRPSVDVLTGIIKANIPTRVSFQVSSRVDSRTILDGNGAESLLGAGDMLFLPPGAAKLQRIHGAFISEAEVSRLTDFWRVQERPKGPLLDRVNFEVEPDGDAIEDGEADERYDEAVEIVCETRQASISMLQRRLRVGYNRAARMIEMMEREGIVAPSDGVKPREVIGSRRN